jgi:hypothetical protein
MKSFKKFKINTKELSPEEKIILKKLISAVERITNLYLRQKNEKYPGGNFYPKDASKEEIQKAAKKNPLILNPYTFVERDKKGKLKAVFYHIKFKKELKPIANLIKEAAKISKNKDFADYLQSRAESLLTGDYEKSDILLLKRGPFKISFIIAPIEWYLDKLFAKKYAYQAWVGILDKEKTEQARELVNIVLSAKRKVLPGSKKITASKINPRIDKTAAFSGLIAEFLISSMNLPRNEKIIKKYGSELTIFEPALKLRFKKDYFPIFQKTFNKKLQKQYPEDFLYKGAIYYTLFNEISYSLIYYKGAEKRLGNLFYIINEFFANILGIKIWGTLYLKGVISQKELEAILIFYICRNFSLGQLSIKRPDIAFHYQTRAAIALNFLLKGGAFKIKEYGKEKGIYSLNFTKVFLSSDELSHLLEYYLALGGYDKAQEFIKEYGSFYSFKKFLNS